MDILVLRKNDDIRTTIKKLNEENDELKKELMIEDLKGENNKDRIVSECLDLIQVCVGVLDKYRADEIDLLRHNEKLLGRGWQIKRILEIDHK